jgi:FemAB-related protein (PEP-CTERM system-associated)
MTADTVSEESVRLSPVPLAQIDNPRAWDAFVFGHPHASPFHLLAWKKTIEESFGYKPVYWCLTDSGQIRAIVPLFVVKNPFLGTVLMSTPFAVYGGILADSGETRRRLYDHVRSIATGMGVDYIELRNGWAEQCVGAPNVTRYVTFSQPLCPDEEALIAALPKKTRNVVRKALRTPFQMRRNVRDARLFDRIHSANMRRLGTPNFPRKYFDRLLANFGPMADICEVSLEGATMAVSLNIYFRKDMHTYHAAAVTRHNSLGPNSFMYYDHLRWAGQNGLESFDFGRSKRDTGTFEFKKHWNTIPRDLPYEIVLIRRKELPNFSPSNPRFDLPIRVWRKLPLPVTRTLSRFVFPLFP